MPIDCASSWAKVSLCSRSRFARADKGAPRCEGDISDHAGNAREAAETAVSTSAAVAAETDATVCEVYGDTSGNVPPSDAGTNCNPACEQ